MVLGAAACSTQPTPTLFLPPTGELQLPTPLGQSGAPAATPTASPVATATALTATPTPCTNDLRFLQDLTIPDGTTVTPGQPVDKQWLVTNSGTCNWDAAYRLKLLSGDAMGAPTEQALYPARAGGQATLRILFAAPQAAGTYQSAWQAFGPDGTAFGEAVYIQISVSP